MPTDFNSAREIAEYLLNRSGRALMSGDFPLFASCFALPQTMETFEGRRLISTRDDLLSVFEGVRAHLAREGVTEMARHCVAAAFIDAETISATHETRLIRGDQLIQRPYPVLSVVRRQNDLWQVGNTIYAIADAPSHAQVFGPTRLRPAGDGA